METFISVIIPVYNVESYIIKCLDSVKNQTFSNFEVLIVNDGSTDTTESLIREYIQKNNLHHFHLINKENGGVSSARNLGIEKAKGTWLCFVDSDDWLEPQAFDTLIDLAKKYDPDLVVGGYQAVNEVTNEKEIRNQYPKEYGKIPQDLDGLDSFSYTWGRLYKNDIISQHHIRFDERIRYAEDNAFQFDYIRYMTSYAATNQVLYSYRVCRPGALTQKLISPGIKLHVWDHLVEFVNAYDEKELEKALVSNRRFSRVFWNTTSTAVINNLLSKDIKEAKRIRNLSLSRIAVQAYAPRSPKEKIFMCLWKHSFLLLRIFVTLYYKNFETLRKSKLLGNLSKTN